MNLTLDGHYQLWERGSAMALGHRPGEPCQKRGGGCLWGHALGEPPAAPGLSDAVVNGGVLPGHRQGLRFLKGQSGSVGVTLTKDGEGTAGQGPGQRWQRSRRGGDEEPGSSRLGRGAGGAG